MKFTDQAIAYIKPIAGEPAAMDLAIPDQLVLRPYSADLCVTYVVDEGNCFRYIQNRHLEADGIGPEQLHLIGLRNLAQQANANAKVFPHQNIFAVIMGGNFEASLILLDDLWENSLRQFVSGDYAIVLPARDILSFCDATSPEGLAELQQVIDRLGSDADHLLTNKIHIRRNGKFEPLRESR